MAAATTDIMFSRAQLTVRVTGMQSMASKMWAPWIIMGFMIVAVALIVDLITSSTVKGGGGAGHRAGPSQGKH